MKKSIEHCKFYGKNLERFLKTDRVATEARNSGVMYQPLGSIYLMVPFNFPFWLTFKSGVPMLAAGNTVLMRGSGKILYIYIFLNILEVFIYFIYEFI